MMFIATYGTLRHGGRLHSAIEECACSGLFRMGGSFVLLQTPAFYPAVVEVPSAFLRRMYDMNSDWWRSYQDANPDTPSPEDWYGDNNGLDTPLVELYSINTTSMLQRLDIIEGVPHLYTRLGISTSAIGDNTATRANSMASYRAALRRFGAARESLHTDMLDETGAYAETYVMNASSDWLQGCDVIWNGDFMNPIMHPTYKFDYVEWREAQRIAQPNRVRRGIPRFTHSSVEIQ